MKLVSTVVALALTACGASRATAPAEPADKPADSTTAADTPAPATPPTLRLPTDVEPTGYKVELALDPAKTELTGHIEIAATVARPTSVVWLNGNHLTIERAKVVTSDGGEIALELLPVVDDFVGFRAATPLAAGAVSIVIDYRGQVADVDTYGVFHQQDRGAWYLYTQFESTGARRAFPCFDEPDYKVPWQLTLEVPAATTAVANTPVAGEVATDHGTKKVTFRETRPLPSYLVAFAVGTFDMVDAGKTRTGVPMRIITTKGRAAEAAWAAESTGRIVALLEDYFGTPYPYAKLDSISIPMTVNFGAMENPGLITYTERLLLTRPEDSSVATKRRYAWVAAHELAHQWFGDLVTPVWWNDIWLNEAFATWMERDTINAFDPSWGALESSAQELGGAMYSDSLDSARQIHQACASKDDIESAFDGITYDKGAAVIRMFENWVGRDVFRTGVQRYLAQHAWKNATSDQFLDAIGEAAGKDVKTPFSTFLDQVGTPLVSFSLRCDQGAAPVLELTQKRYLPLGSKANPDQTWQVPVCVRYGAGKHTGRACTLLTEATGSLTLDGASACPTWVAPNADAIGYYRSQLSEPLHKALLGRGFASLSLPEKIVAVGDVRAQVASGGLPLGGELDLARAIGPEKSRYMVAAAASILASVDDDVPADLRPAYAKLVRDVFGKRARKLGWKPRKGESADDAYIRETIVPLVADQGRDKVLTAQAVRLAKAWLADRSAIDPRLRGEVLHVAARAGDAALYDAFWAEALKADSQRDRRTLLGALGAFRAPELTARSLDAVLGTDLDIRESTSLMWGPLGDPERRATVFAFVEQHFDALVARMPGEAGARLAWVAPAQCDPAMRPRVEKLLARVEKLPSGPRKAAQSLERFELCIQQRQAIAKPLADYLRGR